MNNPQQKNDNIFDRVRRLFVGKPQDLHDSTLMQRMSLIAFFAWVGLGADGLSSSSYGPQEAFIALTGHIYLGILVAIASAITVFVISASYSQIVELFPHGGGGYMVASKLLSPSVGMVAGCALLIDYVLTITVSIASGADAVFSFLPAGWYGYKVLFAVLIIFILILLNMRGVKESVMVLMPIFLLFMVTHVILILYSFGLHLSNFPQLVSSTRADIHASRSALGLFGTIFILLRAYSMGAGTYTGIEAVSNGVVILREPRAATAKRTMLYMASSLAFMVIGIMFSYVFFRVEPTLGKTMNAVLFETMTKGWTLSYSIVTITLLSEAFLLFVAAQTGFIDGPRVLANMAHDRWMPKRFSILSDRLVTQNGIMIMGISALLLMIFSGGSVGFLVVLYSINVFLTFFLSQLGMVRHWWAERAKKKRWLGKIFVNGTGLIMTTFILISVVVIKFHEGGWITLFITGILIALAVTVKRNYERTNDQIRKLDDEVVHHLVPSDHYLPKLRDKKPFDPNDLTAVILVKDFTSMGITTVSTVLNSFKGIYRNFVFLQIGLVTAGQLDEVVGVEKKIQCEVDKFIELLRSHGYNAEGICVTGIDTLDEFSNVVPKILEKYPHSNFFGGQIVFQDDNLFSRWLHNYTLFSMQQRLYHQGIPLFIIPVYVK
jgi:amino acid transporter